MKIKVKCPKCGYVFTTTSIKSVKCPRCNHSFKVYYKERAYKRKWVWKSRIVDIVEGSLYELHQKFYNEFYGGK